MELSVIPNILYSNNPFLITRINDYIDNTEYKVPKTIINVKYWYSSMSDECKSVFHKVVENKVFKIHKGIYLTVAPDAVLNSNPWDFEMKHLRHPLYKPSGVASKFSDAINDKKLLIPTINSSNGFSLIDHENKFVFFVTTKGLWVIDEFGNKVLSLVTHEQHALIVYAAVRSIGIMEENIKAIDARREEEKLKLKIREAYN